MIRFVPLILCMLLFSMAGCKEPTLFPGPLVRGGYDEKEMNIAVKEAVLNLNIFITAMDSDDASNFCVKVPIIEVNEPATRSAVQQWEAEKRKREAEKKQKALQARTGNQEEEKKTEEDIAFEKLTEEDLTVYRIEHVWLKDVVYGGDTFTGIVNSKPRMTTTVTLGQQMNVKQEEISDWMFKHGGKYYGNFTTRVLLKKMTEEEAKRPRSRMGEFNKSS